MRPTLQKGRINSVSQCSNIFCNSGYLLIGVSPGDPIHHGRITLALFKLIELSGNKCLCSAHKAGDSTRALPIRTMTGETIKHQRFWQTPFFCTWSPRR